MGQPKCIRKIVQEAYDGISGEVSAGKGDQAGHEHSLLLLASARP
jgi:hypothetical protein